jgi:hypothetical protein
MIMAVTCVTRDVMFHCYAHKGPNFIDISSFAVIATDMLTLDTSVGNELYNLLKVLVKYWHYIKQ